MTSRRQLKERINTGILNGIIAFGIWGIVPLYWKQVTNFSAWEMLFHRVLWGSIPLGIYLLFSGHWQGLKALKYKKNLLFAVITSILIMLNWGIFIWAVSHGHVLEVSLGYFLNPLLNVVLGTFFLSEKLSRKQQGAVALAAIGLVIMFAQNLGAPWVALALAMTFALYGFVRRLSPLNPSQGLFFETFISFIFMLPFLGREIDFIFPSETFDKQFLAMLAGPITLIPLIFYNRAVKQLAYSTVGIIQYLAPSLQFLLAVVIFKERFEVRHALAFSFIWLAVILYLAETLSKSRQKGQYRNNDN